MADLSLIPKDISKKIRQQIDPRLKNAHPQVILKWMGARLEEQKQQISSKEAEINKLRKIRLEDLEVELELLKSDLKAMENLIAEIQRVGVDCLDGTIEYRK